MQVTPRAASSGSALVRERSRWGSTTVISGTPCRSKGRVFVGARLRAGCVFEDATAGLPVGPHTQPLLLPAGVGCKRTTRHEPAPGPEHAQVRDRTLEGRPFAVAASVGQAFEQQAGVGMSRILEQRQR